MYYHHPHHFHHPGMAPPPQFHTPTYPGGENPYYVNQGVPSEPPPGGDSPTDTNVKELYATDIINANVGKKARVVLMYARGESQHAEVVYQGILGPSGVDFGTIKLDRGDHTEDILYFNVNLAGVLFPEGTLKIPGHNGIPGG